METDAGIGAYLAPLSGCIGEASYILFLDTFVYTSLIPMAAAFMGSRIAHYLAMGPSDELFVIVELVFLFSFLFMGMKVESGFWEGAFNLEESSLVILDLRAIYNVGLLTYYILELVQVVQHISLHGPMKADFLGEQMTHAIGLRVYHWLDVLRFKDDAPNPANPGANLAAANFVLVVALLFGAIAHFVYINTLYGQINAVRDFRANLNLWLDNVQAHRAHRQADVLNNNRPPNVDPADENLNGN